GGARTPGRTWSATQRAAGGSVRIERLPGEGDATCVGDRSPSCSASHPPPAPAAPDRRRVRPLAHRGGRIGARLCGEASRDVDGGQRGRGGPVRLRGGLPPGE